MLYKNIFIICHILVLLDADMIFIICIFIQVLIFFLNNVGPRILFGILCEAFSLPTQIYSIILLGYSCSETLTTTVF